MLSVEFNGIIFRKDKNTGYYKPNGTHANNGVMSLHREVWKEVNGEIKKGYLIHHKDGNKDNNELSNLDCITNKEHARLHPKKYDLEHLARIRELTKVWHGSPEGRAWHSKHAKEIFKKRKPIEKSCVVCGKTFFDYSRRDKSRFCHQNCKAKEFRRRHKEGILI